MQVQLGAILLLFFVKPTKFSLFFSYRRRWFLYLCHPPGLLLGNLRKIGEKILTRDIHKVWGNQNLSFSVFKLLRSMKWIEKQKHWPFKGPRLRISIGIFCPIFCKLSEKAREGVGGGAEILVCEVTIRSDRNGEITQKNNYVYLIVQIFIRNLVICLYIWQPCLCY